MRHPARTETYLDDFIESAEASSSNHHNLILMLTGDSLVLEGRRSIQMGETSLNDLQALGRAGSSLLTVKAQDPSSISQFRGLFLQSNLSLVFLFF